MHVFSLKRKPFVNEMSLNRRLYTYIRRLIFTLLNRQNWTRTAPIFKLLRSLRIDSKKSIPPAYVAWRAGRQPSPTRFLDLKDCLKIPALMDSLRRGPKTVVIEFGLRFLALLEDADTNYLECFNSCNCRYRTAASCCIQDESG